MANLKADNRSFLYGLSDFWLSFFKEIDQLDYLYKGTEIQVGQAYLDLMALLLTNSVQDTPIFNKEYFKYIEIDEDELELVDDEYRYRFDDAVRALTVLNNKVLEPTEALERDADFRVDADDSAIYFSVDPTNAYFEYTFGSANSEFKLQSLLPGDDGGLITLELIDDGTSPVTVSRDQYDITINYDGPANTATGTAAAIVQAINTFDATKGLVVATIEGINSGVGSPAGFGATALEATDVAPLKGFASKLVDKTFGGKFTVSGVDDWISIGVRKGDILRLQGGAQTDHRIAAVRKGALYIDPATPFIEEEDRDDWTILRELSDNESNNEGYVNSGVTVRSGVDGTVDASSSTLQSPTFNLLDIYEGDFVEILGVDNNGYVKILNVLTSVSASVGGIVLTDETPVAWNLISTIDTGNTGTDGLIYTNSDGQTIFQSASATFTAAVAGTNIRTYESGSIVRYAVKAHISGTEVELVETVADKSSLTWGWEKLRTPDNTLLFSPPLAFPIADTVDVSARRALDARAVQRDVDYTVDESTGVVKATNVWLTSITNTVSYEYLVLVTDSSTHGTASLTLEPQLEVQRIAMWGPDALVDKFMLYNTYGYLLGKFDTSSEQYRAFIRGVFQLFMLGPTLGRMESAVNTLAGLPVIRDDGEILTSYDSEAVQSGSDGTFTFTGSTFSSPTAVFDPEVVGNFIYPTSGFNAGKQFTITEYVDPNTVVVSPQPITSTSLNNWEYNETGTQEVITSRATYSLPRVVPVKDALQDATNFGVLELNSFEAIADVFSVVDYVESPTWWEYVLIPKQLMPDAEPGRRQSTPVLYENLVSPADDARVGDPGFFVGADSEGTVPSPTLIRDDAGAADGQLIADPLYPASSVDTFFEAASGAFTEADLGSQIQVDGVYYPVVEVVSATRLRITTYTPVTNATGLSWELYTYPLAKRNKAAFVVLDEYLKHHLFTVSFDLSLLEIMRGDFLADMQSLVISSRPSHTYMILSPAAFLIDVINASEEFELSPEITLGGTGGTPISYNQNALTVGTSWKVGSWFRYIENSSSFTAPSSFITDPLGAPDVGYTNYITKWAPDQTQFTTNSGADPVPWHRDIIKVALTSTGAEVISGGEVSEIQVPDTLGLEYSVGYVQLSGSGAGNDGIYRITSIQEPDTVFVYTGTPLTPEAGLDYVVGIYGTLQGRIWTDDDGVSYFEDLQEVYILPLAENIENYWIRRLTPLEGEEPAYELLEVINDHRYRLGVNRDITDDMTGNTAANTVTITTATSGFVFTPSMAEATAPDRSEIYYVYFVTGTHATEARKILTYVSETEVIVDGGALTNEVGSTLRISKDVHYSTEDNIAEWEMITDFVRYNGDDMILANSSSHDAGTVDYEAEGVRVPTDPTLETISLESGDTYFSIGMQDPLANGGRKFSVKDVELRDEPIEIVFDDLTLFYFDALTWTRTSEAPFFDSRTSTFEGTTTYTNVADRTDFDTWGVAGTPVVTASVADPLGGTDAVTVEDDNAAGYESIIENLGVVAGGRIRVRVYVRGVSGTGIVQMNVSLAGGAVIRPQLDTSDGSTTIFSTSGNLENAVTTATRSTGDWWLWETTFWTPAVETITAQLYPAISGTLGSQSATATGEASFYRLTVDRGAAYKLAGAARILTDNALLTEVDRTNQITESIYLPNWSTGAAGISVSALTAPDGGVAYELDDSSGGTQDYRQSAVTASLSTGLHAVSVFVEKNVASIPAVLVREVSATLAGGNAGVQLDTADGTTSVESGTVTKVAALDAGDWYRLVFVINVTVAGTVHMRLFPARTDAVGNGPLASETGACSFWGMQLEEGSFATSPIRTYGTSNTRDVEYGVLPNASIPAVLQTGTWRVELQPLFDSDDVDVNCVWLDVGAAPNYHMRKQGSVPERHRLAINGTDYIMDLTSGYVAHDIVRWVMDWPGYEWSCFVNGVEDGSSPLDVSAASPDTWATGSDLTVGNNAAGTAPYSGIIYPPVEQ